MPYQPPLPNATNGQLMRPLSEQERVDAALLQMAIRLDKVLTERVINQWHADLERLSVDAIEYAADWCGKNLDRWPKLKQFMNAVNAWMGKREEEDGQFKLLGSAEIERRRREFQDWYRSEDGKEVRAMVQALDRKMNAGRPRLYTPEELKRFGKGKA